MIKKLIFTLSIFFFSSFFGQINFQIKSVVDSSSIPEAEIYTDKNIKVITDENGKAIVDHSSYWMIRKFGFETVRISPPQVNNNLIIIYLKENILVLDELELEISDLGSYRLEEGLRQKVNIDPESIEGKFATNTPEILEKSGYVFVQRSQMGGGSPVIRGFEASRILLLVDGIRINNAITRSGHFQGSLTIDPFSSRDIDILFGPGALAYGSDALGGVINIHSKMSEFSDSAQFHGQSLLRYSSAESEKTVGQILSYQSKKNVIDFSFRSSDYDDLKSGRNTLWSDTTWLRPEKVVRIDDKDSIVKNDPFVMAQSGYSQYDMSLKWQKRLSKQSQFTFFNQLSTSSKVPRYDRLADYDKKPIFSEWYFGPQTRTLSYLKYQETKSRKLFEMLEVSAAFQFNEESRYSRRYESNNLNATISKVYIPSIQLSAFKSLANKGEIQYGINEYFNLVDSYGESKDILSGSKSSILARYPSGISKYNLFGIFLNHSYEWKSFSLVSGIRLDHSLIKFPLDTTFQNIGFQINNTNHLAFSGGLGLQYQWTKDFLLTFNYQSAHRNPTIDDMAKVFDSRPGEILVIPNSDLKAERTHSLELLKQYKNKFINWKSGIYTTFIQEQIAQISTQLNGADSLVYEGVKTKIFHFDNQEYGLIYGFFSTLSWDFGNNWSINQRVSYTRGYLNEGAPLAHIPPLNGLTSVSKKWLKSKMTSRFQSLYNFQKRISQMNNGSEDRIEYATSEGIPAWIIFDFINQFQFKKFNFMFGVKNLLDSHYRTFSSGINGAGRSFVIGLELKL